MRPALEHGLHIVHLRKQVLATLVERAPVLSELHFPRRPVQKAGADVLISNHTNYDGSKVKQPALATRKPGDPHPYVIGNDAVKRYLTVASECAKAALAGLGTEGRNR